MRSRSWNVILLLVGGCTLAACGSSGHSSSSPTTATTATTAPSAASTAPPAAPAGGQHVTITPSQGLHSPATVHVTGTGFSPGEALVVAQCASKGTATTPGDCNLAGVQAATADSAGRVSATLTVIKGPFGTNHIVCSTSQPCLVSVTQPTASTSQEADAPITFS